MNVLDRINKKLRTLTEAVAPVAGGIPEWMDHTSPNYDRQVAEDALFQTIGPLMDHPRWTPTPWKGEGTAPVPEFSPGGPAPRWTEDALVVAYSGDPALLFKAGARDNPRSPSFGYRKGKNNGAPMYRAATQIARQFGRENDKDFLQDLFATGYIELMKLTKPGYDQADAPFIGWADQHVKGAMRNGTSGSTDQTIAARGSVGKDTGIRGIQVVQKSKDPAEIRAVADQVKGKYQTQGSHRHDKHPDNPFGKFSAEFYESAMAYADAMEFGDEASQAHAREAIERLAQKLADDQSMILGASTGAGQAISTQNRLQTKDGTGGGVSVSSLDKPMGFDGSGTMGDGLSSPMDDDEEDSPDTEALQYVLQVALTQDFSRYNNSPYYRGLMQQFGMKPDDNIGGPMTAGEFRYLLRSLGKFASQYPGKGTPRNSSIVREAKGWWTAGTDPEMEPLPGGGGVWHSEWIREGQEAMGPTDIANEMTREVIELSQLGVPVLPDRLTKAQGKKPVLSKAAVGTAVAKGRIKMQMAAQIHRANLGMDDPKPKKPKPGAAAPPEAGAPEAAPPMDENFKRIWRSGGGLLREDLDPIDWRLVNETFEKVINRLSRWILEAKSEELNAPRPSARPRGTEIKWSRK